MSMTRILPALASSVVLGTAALGTVLGTLLGGGLPSVAQAPAAARGPASLVADQVTFDQTSERLTATGNVEVLYEGRVLRATRIVYDQRADRIEAEGLLLTDSQGGVLIAEGATLTPDLEDGLIESARLLIAGQMQLAAAEARRAGGYDTLYRTVASTCTICAGTRPTWSIRASRVIRDEAAQRIYFENASFELFGVPVAWLPRASVPEPGVRRASGFLLPAFRASSEIYGFGFKLPYYRTLGDRADMTVTPFLTTSGAQILEAQYRQRFANGGFNLAGSLALDDGLDASDGRLRGAVSTQGAFRLSRGYVGDFDINWASDDSYLGQFDYSDADRLTSTASIHRTTLDEYVSFGTVAFQALAGSEDLDAGTVPLAFPEFTYRRLYATPGLGGGTLGINGDSLGIIREDGQNMFRAGGSADWTRDGNLGQGVLAEVVGRLDVAAYRAWDARATGDTESYIRSVPTGSIELRWPWMRAGTNAQHVIEPIVQVIYSHAFGDSDVPNEDSQLVEFDDTNLFSLNRFPGTDRLETGFRANLGVSYTRLDPAGWSLGLTAGRVLRATKSDATFYEGTGMAGRWSDYVTAVSLQFDWGLNLVNRSLFNDDLDFARNEFALIYDGARGGVRAAYIYLREDDSNPFIGAQPETSEIALDARYRFLPNWEVRGLWRYDAVQKANLRAGAGITYGNECAEFDLSVQRRYTYTDNLPPSTSVSFGLRLSGFGDDGETQWPARVCMRGA